ncbi:hypothetical protein B0J12DRAFT_394489 [Macrophomina phaseolina]|uniref:Uncharacterized protein n=1 Tax=Macrophomina phaseolina TaxID=35725 RepID=A0ABQ8FUR1_9PEZI|nr:hypothetical protein B0J12DRAFT_394489 [Macrophomina phaseolina]
MHSQRTSTPPACRQQQRTHPHSIDRPTAAQHWLDHSGPPSEANGPKNIPRTTTSHPVQSNPIQCTEPSRVDPPHPRLAVNTQRPTTTIPLLFCFLRRRYEPLFWSGPRPVRSMSPHALEPITNPLLRPILGPPSLLDCGNSPLMPSAAVVAAAAAAASAVSRAHRVCSRRLATSKQPSFRPTVTAKDQKGGTRSLAPATCGRARH